MALTDDDIATCLDLLERSRALDPNNPRFLRLERAAAHLRKHAKKKRRLARKQATAVHDRAARQTAELMGGADGPAATRRARRCYVCKAPYRQIHAVFHLLCPDCGDASQAMREQPLDLTGRRALITGARVKIGYATALACLRAGAAVIATTRFPADAAARYADEPDFAEWRDRLSIHGLDFRRLPDVLRAVESWRSGPPLDILINNAAQTIWHPPSTYAALYAAETRPAQLAVERWTPTQPDRALLAGIDTAIDLQRQHSWVMALEEVPPVEMVEAQVVNNIVPFLLCSRLKPALEASPHADRYIINVAALEGQFQRAEKPARHPHTNMAKAALNMLTRTSAEAYAADGIYMVSVDPGWVSHEGPPAAQARAAAQGFRPPLDMADAAARLLDPIARGLAGQPVYGVLLKDFAEAPW